MGKHITQRLAGMGVGRQRRQRDIVMARRETDQIGARITGRTKNRSDDFLLTGHETFPGRERRFARLITNAPAMKPRPPRNRDGDQIFVRPPTLLL